MPKFNLYEETSGLAGVAPARLEIGWSNGHVQIATCSDNPDVLRSLGEAAAPDQWDWRGVFIPLTRAQINEAIRNLRKARDAAFGRDE